MLASHSVLLAGSLGTWIRTKFPGGEWGALVVIALVVPTLLSFVLIRGSAEDREQQSERNVAIARMKGFPQPWRAAGYSRSGTIMALFILIMLVGSFFVR